MCSGLCLERIQLKILRAQKIAGLWLSDIQLSTFDEIQGKGNRNCQILANLLAAKIGFFFLKMLSMEPVSCLICLDYFKNDSAHIPDLPCSCTLIVHEECWEPWSGECLYCREALIEELPEIQLRIVQNINITYHNPSYVLSTLIIIMLLYFFIILGYTL